MCLHSVHWGDQAIAWPIMCLESSDSFSLHTKKILSKTGVVQSFWSSHMGWVGMKAFLCKLKMCHRQGCLLEGSRSEDGCCNQLNKAPVCACDIDTCTKDMGLCSYSHSWHHALFDPLFSTLMESTDHGIFCPFIQLVFHINCVASSRLGGQGKFNVERH